MRLSHCIILCNGRLFDKRVPTNVFFNDTNKPKCKN